jgi:hypothetical protein
MPRQQSAIRNSCPNTKCQMYGQSGRGIIIPYGFFPPKIRQARIKLYFEHTVDRVVEHIKNARSSLSLLRAQYGGLGRETASGMSFLSVYRMPQPSQLFDCPIVMAYRSG